MKGKLIVEPYWNGYRPFCVTENGNKILLHTAMPTKAEAIRIGKMEMEGRLCQEDNLKSS